MDGPALDTTTRAEQAAKGWYVRRAERSDIAAIARAVAELLTELGATPPPLPAMEAATSALLAQPESGVLLVAEAEGAAVGVLTASWQTAIHVPGRYGLIQDVWVKPAWRGRAIGGALVAALCELAGELSVSRLEVGLPKEGFASLDETAHFYRANGFEGLGPRMRRELP